VKPPGKTVNETGRDAKIFSTKQVDADMRWREMVETYVGIGSVKYVKAAIRVKAIDCDGNALYAVEFYGDL
jgi:hypothetical protein